MPRQHFLACAAFPRDQHRSIRARDLGGAIQQHHHGWVLDHGLIRLTSYGLQHGGDKLRIRRKWQEFLGAGANGAHCGVRVIGPPASNDGAGDTFFRQAGNQPAHIMRYIAKHQVSAIRPQFCKTGSGTFGNGQARATRHGNARRLAEFRFQ